MNYLLDTNVLLHYVRATPLKKTIDTHYDHLDGVFLKVERIEP
ncbi:MAG: hypothetical protein ACKVTZ_05395 [Bacteroidia bacterium]